MFRALIKAAAFVCLATASSAQTADSEFAAGRDEYLVACAACHGEAADGNGPIATMFKSRVPDLTGIAQRNEGVFPMLQIIQTIDGRADIKAHGNPMPVFGRRYEVEAEDKAGVFGSEVIVRGRVLELALYLQSIQS